MCPHASAREGQRWRVVLCVVARGTPVVGDSSTDKESRLQQSWWSVHAPELGLSENLVGKSFRWRWLRSEAQLLDRLPELTTRRNPNPNIPKLFYGSNIMLREKEYYILINLCRRKHTYLYSSVRVKKETELGGVCFFYLMLNRTFFELNAE